jgi:hypothetical protein
MLARDDQKRNQNIPVDGHINDTIGQRKEGGYYCTLRSPCGAVKSSAEIHTQY